MKFVFQLTVRTKICKLQQFNHLFLFLDMLGFLFRFPTYLICYTHNVHFSQSSIASSQTHCSWIIVSKLPRLTTTTVLSRFVLSCFSVVLFVCLIKYCVQYIHASVRFSRMSFTGRNPVYALLLEAFVSIVCSPCKHV